MRIGKCWGLIRWSWAKLLLLLSWLAVAGLGFYWGRCALQARVNAAPVPPMVAAPAPQQPGAESSSDYARQPVAYIHGVIPITRADLGEYLIARYGADRLDLLINHRIIDEACQQKGIEVSAAEIEAALNEDLKGLAVNKLDFVKVILKRYNKTLYEWREDVIRPRLLLSKLCKDRVSVTDQDLRDAYEAHHGEKVLCKVIIWPKTGIGGDDPLKVAQAAYAELRDDPAEFDRVAQRQASPTLAAHCGELPPIGHHTMGGDETSMDIEKMLFALQPGELSPVRGTPEGAVVFKCVKHVPPEKTRLADVQPALEKEVKERKIQATIPVVFAELRQAADPQKLLKGYQTQAEVEKEVQDELHLTDPTAGQRGTGPLPLPPQGH